MPEVRAVKSFGPEEEFVEEKPDRRWQIKYKSGAGQQVYGFDNEEAVRKWAAGFWGADYEILSVEEIQPPRD